MRKEERMRVDKYMCIDTVLYNSPNLLLVETRRRTEKAAYIICEGLSMSVDTKYNVPLKEHYQQGQLLGCAPLL